MTNKELIKLAYDMGAHPYSVGGMVAALQKGIEIGKEEQRSIDIYKACEWLRNELPAYLGLFTSHFQDDDDVEQVVVKACVNAQIYDDLKNVLEE